jgi:dUTP pyrophosphatase
MGKNALINTAIRVMPVDPRYYLEIRSRSGLAVKGAEAGAGIIDSDYIGLIKVILYNHTGMFYGGEQKGHGNTILPIKKGDRIGQLIIRPRYVAEFEQVESLTQTERGTGGFGSTGV